MSLRQYRSLKHSIRDMVSILERECASKGIRVIYDELRSEGGVCRVKGDIVVVINRRAPLQTRMRILSEALNRAKSQNGG